MAELLYRLGKFSARRPWTVVIAWLIIAALSVGGFLVFGKGLSSSFDIPGTASEEVTDELAEKLPDMSGSSGTVVFTTEDGSAFTDDQRAAIGALVASATDLPDVSGVNDPFASEQERADRLQELEDARTELEDGRAQLDAAQTDLDAGLAQLDDGQAQLDAGQAQLDAARAQAEAAGFPTAQLDAQQAQLDAQQAQLDSGRQQLVDGQDEIDSGRADLESGAEQLELGARLLELASAIGTVSADGSTAIVNVSFDLPRLELPAESKEATMEHFESSPIEGVEVAFGTDVAQEVPEILGIGEAIGVLIAAVILIVMLGSVLAASFPIITALVGVAIGATSVLAFSGVVQMASVTPVLGVMLGLAVGIDYALFIINRHRRQLLEGAEVRESIGLATGTAGNAVVFAGSTVIVALLALNVTGIPFLGLMGIAGAVSVLAAVLLAISLTPALLGLAGMRVLGKRARARVGHAAPTGADAVEADPATASGKPAKPVRQMSTLRAVVTVLATIAALVTVALPAASMRVGLPDGSSEPADSTAYRAYTVIDAQFGEGANGTLLVTADLPGGLDDEQTLATQVRIAEAIAAEDAVLAVAPIAVSDDGLLAAFQVQPTEGPTSVSTEQLVRDLRTMTIDDDGTDLTLGVAGLAASNIDISEGLADILPLYLVVVVGLSFLIMVVVFRSLLVPLIATGGFILSLLATYGAITAVFQWGWLAPVFGITSPGPILSFLPVILVGILFGLAMDYQLFLASGMREAYVHGSSARLAVAQGFRAGRSVVIAAGLIMVSVFAGFVSSESMIIRSLGFGLALGVLLDAFVVRMLLMPALMHLLGRSAWWLPRWLNRIIPNVDVEGAALERRHHATPEPASARS